MDKEELEKLYTETNEKFIGRVEHMLYYICGCGFKRGKIVLEECLRRNKSKEVKQ